MRDTPLTVAISLVVYNGEQYLEECLNSVKSQTYSHCSLTVLDNFSTDSSLSIVRRIYPECTIIQKQENIGFARAHNAIIHRTNTDAVLILNQDCILDRDYVWQCVKLLIAEPSCASVTGVLYRTDTLTAAPSSDTIDTLGLGISRTFHSKNCFAGKRFLDFARIPFMVFGVSATAALYRRSALEDIALPRDGSNEYFDEDFFMYKEDVDLAFRLYRLGWTAFCQPSARGYHVRSTDQRLLARSNAWINRISYRNHWWFLWKNIDGSQLVRYGFFIAWYEVAKFLYLFIFEHNTVHGFWDAVKLRKVMFAKRAYILNKSARSRQKISLQFGCRL